jgi:predicted ATPase/DNA-binding CsgD family transcriptional regulator/transcriptional regulator with XRE-family HTH domain
MTPDELGQRRRRLGLSQAQLGSALGVAGNTVARWERGDLRLRNPELVMLALERLEQAAPAQILHPPPGPVPQTAVPGHERGRLRGKYRHNLPLELNEFLGRSTEVVEVRGLLGETRLLTLTGAGGVGKTRLAQQVARELLAEFADGVWLVELAPLADASLVARAVAVVLGVYERPEQPLEETLVDVLGTRRLLLVLDNCEHLVAMCAALVERLLTRCPHVRVLATSREHLGISGETTWRVPSLSLPLAERSPSVENLVHSDAVRLFAQRASQALPGFAVTQDNALAIAQVCRRLDGIPLALELAAARVNSLTVAQIASRLDDSLGLLTTGGRTTTDRQRTLRGTLDWSYDLLSVPERTLLGRLAVFAGGWTLQAAEVVCADAMIKRNDVLDLLDNLVHKSLVMMEERRQSAWYRLLDPLHAYAHEKLAPSEDGRRCRTMHRDWYVQLVELFEVEWRGERQAIWFDTLEREEGNLRVALRYCVDHGDIAAGLRLAGPLARFWDLRSRSTEGRAWLSELLSAIQQPVPESIMAKALSAAGFLAAYQGDVDLADAYLTEGIRLWRSLGSAAGLASSLIALGNSAQYQQNHAKAEALWLEGLAASRAAEDRVNTYWALHELARDAIRKGELARAKMLNDESLALKRKQGDGLAMSYSLLVDAELAWLQRKHEQALALMRESLMLLHELGHWRAIAMHLNLLAHVTADCGKVEESACLFGVVEALQKKLGDKRPVWIALNVNPARTEASLAACRARLAPAAFETAWATGQAMTTDEAVEYALNATAADVSATDAAAAMDTRTGLTPRETEVLRLVAGGNSNQQIAAELVLSLRTVERHITNVYAKVGARNRADATAYALRHGMG